MQNSSITSLQKTVDKKIQRLYKFKHLTVTKHSRDVTNSHHLKEHFTNE